MLEAQPGQRPRARRAGRDAAGPGPLRRGRRRGRRGRPRGAAAPPPPQRTELFALLTDGDARPTPQLGRRACADDERAVFAAWQAVRSGAGAAGRAAGRRRRAACSSCSTRSRACRPSTPSRTSSPCSRPSRCPWRERREALAELYLRHGYADSAAEEWIAVVRAGRRRRAMRCAGSAAVAAARGPRRGRPGLRRRGRGAGRGLIRAQVLDGACRIL